MFKLVSKIDSQKDDVTKYIIEDSKFGKNEVSVIRKKDKIILCVPSQTNCKMGCSFCHLTGTTRPAKNLPASWLVTMVEYIVEQEGLFNSDGIYDNPLDLLISFMGVGEPLLNLKGLKGAIANLHLTFPGIRFGISTMMPSLKLFGDLTKFVADNENYLVKVHLSVHGVFNRDQVVKSPVNIEEAIRALQIYQTMTGSPIEYHYTLVRGVNDSVGELTALYGLITMLTGIKNKTTMKFLKLSETNGCQSTLLTESQIKKLFPGVTVEFYDPPGRDVGSSCGMFDQSIYNEEITDADSKTQD